MWCIHTIEYYSSLKKQRNFTICDNMDGLGRNYGEISQSQKNKYCIIFPYMQHLKESHLTEAEDTLVVARGWGEGVGKSFNGYEANSHIR